MAVVVEVLADLLADLGQLRREFTPPWVFNDLSQSHFILHAGQAVLVLPGAEEGDEQASGLGIEAEDEVVSARFRFHFRGEEVAEARPPVCGGSVFLCLFSFLFAQFVNEFESKGGHVAADAGEGF